MPKTQNIHCDIIAKNTPKVNPVVEDRHSAKGTGKNADFTTGLNPVVSLALLLGSTN